MEKRKNDRPSDNLVVWSPVLAGKGQTTLRRLQITLTLSQKLGDLPTSHSEESDRAGILPNHRAPVTWLLASVVSEQTGIVPL